MNRHKLLEIYLDIDGVLNRWMIHEMSRRCGRTIAEADWPVHLGWDIRGVMHHITGRMMGNLEFWNSVPESSWVDAPKSELFGYLIDKSAEIVGRENVHVVTSVPPDRNPAAYSGKAIWCSRHMPEWLCENLRVVTGKKYKLAQPGRLLIDDATHNVEAWDQAGGQSILVPRPWNVNHECDTIGHVRYHLDSYATEAAA